MSERPAALVTGASRGIGAETAEEFARRGYDVALLARTASDLAKTADRVTAAGGTPLVLCGDLADLAFAESAVAKTVETFGRVDVLVNNAAWRELVSMRTISVESWEKTLRISLTAPGFLARWCAVHMEKRGKGVIINISSTVTERCSGFAPAYMAAKGALDTLTFDLAALYGPVGIRVVGVNPGAIDTEMARDFEYEGGDEMAAKARAMMEDATPLRRYGRPDEIAKVIAWVASDDASFLTGTSVLVDGGVQHQLLPGSVQSKMLPGEFP